MKNSWINKKVQVIANFFELVMPKKNIDGNSYDFVIDNDIDAIENHEEFKLNKSLKHLEYINQLKNEISDEELKFFPQDFLHDLETNILISQINTVKSAVSMKVGAP